MKLANCTGPDFIQEFTLDSGVLRGMFHSSSSGNVLCNALFGSNVRLFFAKLVEIAMLCWSHPFKIIGSVISFVFVFVMNILGIGRIWYPAISNDPVHKSSSSKSKVSVTPDDWSNNRVISKNLPAPRNGVQVVEETIFDSVYLDVQHGGLRSVNRDYIIAQTTQGV